MIANIITTSKVPITSTFRATPGVEPARASVAVSRMGGSDGLGSAITLSSRNHCSTRQRAHRNPVPTAKLLRRRDRRRVEEERLGDGRLHGGALERLGDEE